MGMETVLYFRRILPWSKNVWETPARKAYKHENIDRINGSIDSLCRSGDLWFGL